MVDIEYSADGKAKIPFRDGNLLSYPNWYGGKPIEWRDNYVFGAVLTYTGFYRGRSAAGSEWKDEYGHSYPMFLKDLEHALRHGIDKGGVIKAEFTFQKRGGNYGIVLADAPKDKRMPRYIYVRGADDVNDLTKLRYADWKGVAGKEVDYETERGWWRSHHLEEQYSKDHPPRYIAVYGPEQHWSATTSNHRYFEVPQWTRKGEVKEYI
jgi:hypothetical protein